MKAKCGFDPRCPLPAPQSAFRLDPLAIHTIQNGLFTHKVTHRFPMGFRRLLLFFVALIYHLLVDSRTH